MPTKQPHSERGHAEFSPSQLKYVASCAGFHGRSGTSSAAEMGTRIHEALEVRDPSALHDEDELEIYEACVDMEDSFLEEAFSTHSGVAQEHHEVFLKIELDGCDTYGTCDRLSISEDGTFAVLADYKTGISTIDPPHSNQQAMAYTVGVFQKYPSIDRLDFAFYVPQRSCDPLVGSFERSEIPVLVEVLSNIIKEGARVRPQWGGGQCPDKSDCTPTQYCRFE